MNLNIARTIGIISIKGGVGKTTSAVSLGYSLVKDFGKKVLIIDGNLSSPNLGLHTGVYNPSMTMHDVIEGKANAKDAVIRTNYGFDVIAGSLENKRIKITPFKLVEKLRDLRKKYDIIIIDSSPNLGDEILATMMASDELIAVTTADYITLAATLRAIKTAKDKRTPITGLIVNKSHGKAFELSLDEIEELSGLKVLGLIPHEIGAMEALSSSSPLTTMDNEASIEYKKLAGALVGKTFKEKNFAKEIISKIFGRIPKQEVNRDLLKIQRINAGR